MRRAGDCRPSLLCLPADERYPPRRRVDMPDMIALNSPILTQHISIPKDMSSLSCEAFTAGVVEGVLDGLDFVRRCICLTRSGPPTMLTFAAHFSLRALTAGKGDGARGPDRAAPSAERRPHQAQPARHGARRRVQCQAVEPLHRWLVGLDRMAGLYEHPGVAVESQDERGVSAASHLPGVHPGVA